MASPPLTPVTLMICRTCGYKQQVREARAAAEAAGNDPDDAQFDAENPLSHTLARQTSEYLALNHAAVAPHVIIKLTSCLSVCDHGLAWGLRAIDRFAYVFAHAPTDPVTGPRDLAATAVAYAVTRPGAKIPKDKIPASIRPHLLAKLPPV